jgi:hypothetical protein
MRVASYRGAAAAAALAVFVGAAVGFGAAASPPQGPPPAPQTAPAGAQTAEPTTLTIGEQTAPPGAPVVVPLTLSAPDTVKPGSIEIRVTYPKATLTFAKLDPSGLALGASATIEANVGKGPDAASSTLIATIATPADPAERKALASGLLAYIGFTIAKDAKPGTTVPVKLQSIVRTADAEEKPVAAVTSVNGKVTITAPPVISCFFYMH